MGLTAESLPVVWERVLGKVGPTLALRLGRADMPAIFGPKTIVLRFPSSCHLDYDECREPDRVERIETALRHVTAQEWSVRVELSPAPPTGGAPPGRNGPSPPTAREQMRQALELPLLKRLVEVFGAEVRKVDPGFGTASGPADDPAPGDVNRE